MKLCVLSACLASIVVALAACSNEPREAPATATVVVGDIEQNVTALGKLEPKAYVDVGAQVSGQLRAVHVEVGGRVEAGQLLAEIDAQVIESRVRADEARVANLAAQLEEQRANLALSEQQHKRNVELFKRSLVSADVRDTSAAAVEVARARLKSIGAQHSEAQSTLEGDRASLGYARIHAPVAGTVVALTAVVGQTLNASQVTPTILRIADLDTMTVVAQVAEADVGRVEPDMAAYFTTLGNPDRRWRTKVRQVQPTPVVLNDVVLFNVLMDVDNRDGVLLPGMTTQVFFPQRGASDVPVVPIAALEPLPGDATSFRVRVRGAKGVETRTIVVGARSRTLAEVVSGLKAGENVLVPRTAEAGEQRGQGRRSVLSGGGRGRGRG